MANAALKTQAAASAQAMYASPQPGAIGGASTVGPGTLSRKVVIVWAAAGAWLFFVGWAARGY